jgi:hypothetical protein
MGGMKSFHIFSCLILFATNVSGSNPGVYAIECVPGYVKVGRANDISQRMKELQTACPFDLKLLAVLSHDPNDESIWHHRFRSCHYRGEWFHECPLVMGAIKNAGKQ